MPVVVVETQTDTTCNLVGGLGNQLFQIFTTIAYAKRNNINFHFKPDKVLTTGRHRPTYWKTFLSGLESHLLPIQETNEIMTYYEPWFHYKQIPAPLPPLKLNKFTTIILSGYFQTEEYFLEYRSEILKMIDFDRIQLEIKSEFFPPASSSPENNITSIHFRLGDYLKTPDYHPIMTTEYYSTALNLLCSVLGCEPSTIFFFCEEESNLHVNEIITILGKSYPNIKWIKVDDNISDWKQMVIMSCCDHHIIANSSFSWWGAWLNPSVSKNVYYPMKWFGKAFQGITDDLIPKNGNWIGI